MAHAWPEHFQDWDDLDLVRRELDAGADPNQPMWAIGDTPLHRAARADAWPDVFALLVSRGAEVEARNAAGETPLWIAVRKGNGRAVCGLLEHQVRPWEPVLDGRSAGRMALHGDLAPLFLELPGAPPLSAAEQQRQAEADAVIRGYEGLEALVYPAIAFVGGVELETVIRRMGADPADCPEVDLGGYSEFSAEAAACWVGSPPRGGVVVVQMGGIVPVMPAFQRAVSAGGGTVTSFFDNPASGGAVDWWRDGQPIRFHGQPFLDPDGGPAEAWLCRFGDGLTDLGANARMLALMGMLTGISTDRDWLARAPKRLVRLAER